ncbi:MAG: aromatic amino acid ammonia-lyase [Gammaproteobacteria bacterium]|nr:aromatic amino acid ammonia-lyase [Gammaproteobacteria bacterium]MDH5592803.1 aromatic amino acid ammonia-lyase [Gammaproteobacteria bacterium]
MLDKVSHEKISEICFGDNTLSINDIEAISKGAVVELNGDADFRKRIDKGVLFLDRLLEEEGVIYGVTTGYGDSCTVTVPKELANELPLHLTRFHGCGLGQTFSHQISRAIMGVRLASLSRGVSGVRYELMERLVELLNLDVTPVIPQEGSVGASGDLTPLSYVAALLIGERDASYKGKTRPASEILKELNIDPLVLRPKEGLAIMNGTAVMTAIACLAYKRADYLAQLASRITSLVSIALQGNVFHFDEMLFSLKPHPGQSQIASWIRSDLEHEELPRNSSRLQDQYSLRCAPHVIGVLQDAMPMFKNMIETELNSANDNPLIDGEGEHVLHGGHFYGGHIAFVMDSMKTCVANIADLLDRQMALMMDTRFNRGLPANLSGAQGDRKPVNHGFKALQIGTSAWTAEALKQTMPASVFSRSTECHNQDKVSMGTIASRDCLRVLELTEQVAVSVLLAGCQAVKLRCQQDTNLCQHLTPVITGMINEVMDEFPLVEEDRPLESELRKFISHIQNRKFRLYEK